MYQEITLLQLQQLIRQVKKSFTLEVHAGVYPFLDVQQLTTQASPSATSTTSLRPISTSDIALTTPTEVCSLYPRSNPPEALIAAGTLALGRQPCKSYPGWRIVSDWGMRPASKLREGRSGWQVGRISQEHGILIPDRDAFGEHNRVEPAGLAIGQKARIWPNHACVAGAMFDLYYVVDSGLEGREDEVVGVWVRCRGW